MGVGSVLGAGLVVSGRHASEATEVFGEEGGVGEVHLFGYLCSSFVCVAQFYFDSCDDCLVYPFFGGGAGCLSYHCAEVVLCEAHSVCIVCNSVVFGAVLCDELDESVEYGLFSGSRCCPLFVLELAQLVVVLHLCSHECCDGWSVVVFVGMDYLPDGVQDVPCSCDFLLGGGELEVPQLAVEGRWHLSVWERHGEFGEECYSEYAEVVRQPLGVDDGARAEVYECAAREVPVLQVDVDVSFAAYDDA